MLQAMVTREVQKEHSCTKTLWLERRGSPAAAKAPWTDQAKSNKTRCLPAARRGTLLLRLNFWICYGAIYLSLSPVYAVSVL